MGQVPWSDWSLQIPSSYWTVWAVVSPNIRQSSSVCLLRLHCQSNGTILLIFSGFHHLTEYFFLRCLVLYRRLEDGNNGLVGDLRVLDLSKNKFGDLGTSSIIMAIHRTTFKTLIRHLNIAENEADERSARSLRDLLSFSHVSGSALFL